MRILFVFVLGLFLNLSAVDAGTLFLSKANLGNFGSCPLSYATAPARYKIWGTNVGTGVTITAPLHFEISLQVNQAYGKALYLPNNGSAIDTTEIFVRFAPLQTGALNGVLSHVSSGSPSVNLNVVGTGAAGLNVPANYYSGITQTGSALLTALYNKIAGHTAISYASLWTAFPNSDAFYDGKVWDIYSTAISGPSAAYTFTYSTNQCGSYSVEGDCYNREHSFPQSWFNSSSPMVSDMYHIFPTDGKVNGMRSNYPYGEVGTTTWVSQIGGKLGSSISPGYSSIVFEPVDEYKGDLARAQLYMATRYNNLIASWQTNGNADDVLAGNAYPAYDAWELGVLVKWHNQDPPSVKEINRNNSVFTVQANRNPFVDSPQFVNRIWGLAKPSEPSMASSQLSLDSFTTTAARLRWRTGNGNRRLVVMRMGSPVNQLPLDSFNYPASSVFGSGTNLGNGNFVVYNGMGSGVIVTGLNPNQPYYVSIFEYNGVNSTANYNTSNFISSFTVFLPVDLLSFQGKVLDNDVELNWKTASEKNAFVFELERSFDLNKWIQVGELPAAGNSRSIKTYSLTDKGVFSALNHVVFYRLKMIDLDGSFNYSQTISFEKSVDDLSELNCFPNPINQSAIQVEGLNENQNYHLYVYDIRGLEVMQILDRSAHNKQIVLNGELKTGVYFFKFVQGNSSKTKLMIVE
ncbi:MAG: endonuclease [Bacteroidia bacterium]